jgi:hypothetical protein
MKSRTPYLFLIWLSMGSSTQADSLPSLSSTWPRAYAVRRNDRDGTLTLSVPYYTVQHDLKNGGALSGIQLTYGRASNLLARPLETRVTDASGKVLSDLGDHSPRVAVQPDGLNEIVTVESQLKDAQGHSSGIDVKTSYNYRWGYIRIHKELAFSAPDFRVTDLCPLSTVLAPALTSYGYRDGLSEQEGAPAFSFNACHWGHITGGTNIGLDTPDVPRYVMLADPGVEGVEWFVSSDLAPWELSLTGKRGQGKTLLHSSGNPSGIAFSVSPFSNLHSPSAVPARLAFDFYIGVPLLEGHAFKPWFHRAFNRNQGQWLSAEQIHQWAADGVQTVHCHNDGDYYGDGLFWRDGSYPPYPDMDKYDAVIAAFHQAGIRVATYFSNKELHPSTPQFQQHGIEWGRMNLKGGLQHNAFNDKSEFGAQMCLRSGWLDNLKESIDRVLTHHRLDGVYYDWNVALDCCNPRHEKLQPDQAAAGHWDIDELLNLMEWTRQRVGPHGLVIVHDTGTPMFATENFADDVVAHEWGYAKWTGSGPDLSELPLEWSLVNARPRGVISYGMIASDAPPHLPRLFALEALLAGVTPWAVSSEALALYPVLHPIGALQECRFADWRNQAVTLGGQRFGSAIYSRPKESWIIVGNLAEASRTVSCVLHPDKLPCPLSSITMAALLPSPQNGSSLDAKQLTGAGITLTIPSESAVLLHVR